MNELKSGIYQHYKGGTYRLIGVGKDSNTLEKFVIYEALYNNPESHLWVRPLKEFTEQIVWPDGEIKPRYYFLND